MDPDSLIIKQNSKKNPDFTYFVTSLWLFIDKVKSESKIHAS